MKNPILILLFIAALGACKKDGPAGPAGPQGPAGPAGTSANGTIRGKVKLYSEFGTLQGKAAGSATVTIEGTSYKAVTDTGGNYVLSDVKPGIYTIVTTKPGYATYKQPQVSFAGNGTLLAHQYAYEIPKFSLNNVSTTDFGGPGSLFLQINITTNPSDSIRGLVVIAGFTDKIDLDNPASYDVMQFYSLFGSGNTVTFNMQVGQGKTVHVRVYPYNTDATGATYYDPVTDKWVYPAHGSPWPATFKFVK